MDLLDSKPRTLQPRLIRSANSGLEVESSLRFMPKIDRPKSLPNQEPLHISLRRWEALEERGIERKWNFHQDLAILPLTRFLKLPELLRLRENHSLRPLREPLSRFLDLVFQSDAPLMVKVLRKLHQRLTPENWYAPSDKIILFIIFLICWDYSKVKTNLKRFLIKLNYWRKKMYLY